MTAGRNLETGRRCRGEEDVAWVRDLAVSAAMLSNGLDGTERIDASNMPDPWPLEPLQFPED